MIWAFSSANAASAHRAREQFVRALKLRGGWDADYGACELIFGELVGNVVRHAPGYIRIILDWTGRAAVLSVEDHGPIFDFNPALPNDPLNDAGRGLFIVTALSNDVEVLPQGDCGKTVRVVLPVEKRVA